MTPRCDELAAFVAGELDEVNARAMRRHLGTCATCQAELEQLVLEESVTHPDGRAPAAPKPESKPESESAPVPEARRPRARRRTALITTIAISVAAAAAVAIWLSRRGDGDGARGPAVAELATALRPERSIEVRLAGSDAHRPYSVARAGTTPEAIPLATLAALEQRGAWSALFAAQMLRGDLDGAAAALAREPDGAAKSADASALALASGRPDAALGHAAAALAVAPDLAVALWNDAVARRALRLPLTAAARFDAVAALGEPGWSDEARATAAELRRVFGEYRDAWRAARDQAKAMTTTGAPLDPAVARRFPDVAAEALHEALRRRAGDEVAALAPVAAALDAVVGGDGFAAAAARAAAGGPARAALAADYAALADRAAAGATPPTAAAWAGLARRARRAAPDVALGALAHAVTLDAALVPELEAIAPRDDAWLAAWVDDRIAWSSIYVARRMAAAELHLARAVAACAELRVPARCARLQASLALVLADRGRRDLAVAHLERAMAAAGRAQDLGVDVTILYLAGEISVGRDPEVVDRVTLAAAYFDERSLQSPDCRADLYRLDHLAIAALDTNRIAEARRWSDEAEALTRGRCRDVGSRNNGVLARSRAIQGTGAADADAVVSLREEITAMRAGSSPGELAILDHAEGRALIERDPAAGEALLRRAIAAGDAATADAVGVLARELSLNVLALAAGRRGDHAAALAAMAERLGRAAPERCAVGVAGEGDAAVVVVGADGAFAGAFRPGAVGKAIVPGDEVVPADLAARLAGCAEVDVYAPGVYYGQARLLPRELAWRYRSPAAGPAAGAPAAGAGPRLVVTDVEPPAALGLPALRDAPVLDGATVLRGAGATPRRALAEMALASEIEIHAHGFVDVREPGAAALILSSDADGDYVLDAERVRGTRLRGRPLVLLAACHAARVPIAERPWGLADAFLAAGARTVIASTEAVPDAGLAQTFAALGDAVRAGQGAATAVRDRRVAAPDRSWLDAIVVFE
jgi:hypothetical protein